MPTFPVDDIDILIIDWMGKDISGAGLDTNIIGRMYIKGQPEPEKPRINMIIIRDLTPRSHGNAVGLGLADVITRNLFEKIDFNAMNENGFTSSFLERLKIPLVAKDDAYAIRCAQRACHLQDGIEPTIVRIRDTLSLGEIYASESIIRQLKSNKGVTIPGDTIPLLDGNGTCPKITWHT